MSAADAVLAALVGPLSALGVDVEDVQVQRAGRRHVVRIVVDRDGGVDLDQVAEVSQRASELLDAPGLADEVPGPFVLEVTSPGVDRPLTEPRHWRRAISRLVEVQLRDGSTLTGRVVSAPNSDPGADDDSAPTVVLQTAAGERLLSLGDVERAVVQVEFSRTADEDKSVDEDLTPGEEE